ncbi:22877_t:CDS:1, partial [Gigaspora rosea]
WNNKNSQSCESDIRLQLFAFQFVNASATQNTTRYDAYMIMV